MPHVVVVPVGPALKVLNSDGILHNVHTFPTKNTPMNTAQPGFRKTLDATFTAPETVRVGCDVHPWMGAHIVVTDTPFVAVTDENGAFSIEGVPAGTYTVSIWHETFGEQTQQVTVTEGQKTNLSVAMVRHQLLGRDVRGERIEHVAPLKLIYKLQHLLPVFSLLLCLKFKAQSGSMFFGQAF